MGCCFGKSRPPSPPHDRKFVIRPTAPAPANDHDREKEGPKKSDINSTKSTAGKPGHVVYDDRDQKKQVVHDDDDDDDDDGDGGDKKKTVDHDDGGDGDQGRDQKKLGDHGQQKVSRGANVINSREAAKVYKGSVLVTEYGVAPDHQKRHDHY
ncbi:hypothetical protein TorRG33x02_111460 [Trema orientale]|uniref:Uncharacterized protein n=1 Tax=Trema orientale TaxID=63057 RepID=A0A2P5F610_TREOI|nr:hypothetical protein TorRG33x02_111460 [Trema orientale]